MKGSGRRMRRRGRVGPALAAALLALLAGGVRPQGTGWGEGAAEARGSGPWRPRRPVMLIVPWEAGGTADQVARQVARELEGPLGQKVVVVNEPGAGGSAGTRDVLRARHDGLTWSAGAAADLGSYAVAGLLETRWQDWQLFLLAADVPVLVAGAATAYLGFQDLQAAAGERGKPVTVATVGAGSVGYRLMETAASSLGVRWRHLPCGSGAAAALAAASGEAALAVPLVSEAADLLRMRELRALAVVDERPLELKGWGAIPPVTRWVPRLKAAPVYFGIWVPRDAPAAVIATMGRLWDTVVRDSPRLRDFAADRGMLFDPCRGEVAVYKAAPALQRKAWELFDEGRAQVSPARLGIAHP